MKRIISAFIFGILIISSVGCHSSVKPQYPTDYEKLSGYIGKTKDLFFDDFGITEENEEVRSLYKMSEQAGFLGNDYDVYLGLDESSGTVSSIQYKLTIQNNLDVAVKEVGKLKNYLLETYGENKAGLTNALTKQNNLKQALSQKQSYYDRWDITDDAPKHIKEYVGNELSYQLCVTVVSDGSTNVGIEISYQVRYK